MQIHTHTHTHSVYYKSIRKSIRKYNEEYKEDQESGESKQWSCCNLENVGFNGIMTFKQTWYENWQNEHLREGHSSQCKCPKIKMCLVLSRSS